MAAQPPIRVGIVGLGLIAQGVHLPNLATLRDTYQVVHVCDVSLDRAVAVADGLPGQVRTSADWTELVADPDVDAVFILTPGSHGDVAIAALNAGKHVMSEKPLAYSIAESQRIEDAARASGRVIQVGYMKMYDPIIERTRQELSELGTIRVVRITVLHPTDECQFEHVSLLPSVNPDPALLDRGVQYSADRLIEALGDSAPGIKALYENVLLGSVVHQMALLRALNFGLPEEFDFVSVDPLLGDPDPDGPPRILAVGKLPNGAQMQLCWNWVPDYPEYTEDVTVFASAGRLQLAMPGPYLPAHRAFLRVERLSGDERLNAEYFSSHRTAFVAELEAFARCVRDGESVVSHVAGSIDDVACLQRLVIAAGAREGVHTVAEVANDPAGTSA
ncbi:MAG: Gfo/Idh/MocA family oxidoreductase [Actinomycetes bacterium]